MTESGMMNIYWIKIKLRAAANQAMYVVYFYIKFTSRLM